MAGYWGLNNQAERISNRTSPAQPMPAEFAGAATAIHQCGQNWVLDLDRRIEADNRYSLRCAAYNRRPQPDSDLIVLRRASNPVTTPPPSPRLRLAASRTTGQLFIAPCAGMDSGCSATSLPALPAGTQLHDLLVHAYYVSRDSTGRTGAPSLRRKRLQGGPGGASLQDEEIISGVENLQVELGIAPPHSDVAPAGVVFVDPVMAMNSGHPVVAVRLWLLVRAETPETGFIDNRRREFPVGQFHESPDDGYRRLLATTTVYLRNTRS